MVSTPTLQDETASAATEAVSVVKIPPTNREVSQTLCQIVHGMASREESLKALDTIADWSKQDYAVHTFGVLKIYAVVPKLLDYLQDHIGKEQPEQRGIQKAVAAAVAKNESKEMENQQGGGEEENKEEETPIEYQYSDDD